MVNRVSIFVNSVENLKLCRQLGKGKKAESGNYFFSSLAWYDKRNRVSEGKKEVCSFGTHLFPSSFRSFSPSVLSLSLSSYQA